MVMVDADWSIDRQTGNIRYEGDAHGGASPSYATVIEFHRWLQDFADDATSTGDDELDITSDTPSERSTDNIITLINGYNITYTAISGDINQTGVWKIQAKVVTPAGEWYSSIGSFSVYSNL